MADPTPPQPKKPTKTLSEEDIVVHRPNDKKRPTSPSATDHDTHAPSKKPNTDVDS